MPRYQEGSTDLIPVGAAFGYLYRPNGIQPVNSVQANNQLDQLVPEQHLFVDTEPSRPQYAAMLRQLRMGDVVYLHSSCCEGSNCMYIKNQWRLLTQELGVDVCVVDFPMMDTRKGKAELGSFAADLILELLTFAANRQCETIRARQREGIPKPKGVRCGRPRVPLPEDFDQIVSEWEHKRISYREAIRQSGLSDATFYRRLQEYRTARSAD